MITQIDKMNAKELELGVSTELIRISALSKVSKMACMYNYEENENTIEVDDLDIIFKTINESSSLVASYIDRLDLLRSKN